jgi:hypothetical protein
MTDDKAFREWVQQQPSCISGAFSEWVNGEGRNPACPIRRAATSGVGFKAPYSGVPLTHEEHRDQHQYGEAGCLERHLGGTWTPAQAREWFDVQAAKCRLAWERQQ